MYARLLSHKKWSLLLIFLLLSAALVACGGTAEAPTTTGAPMATEPPEAEPETTLTVFAAASLTDAFTEIAAAFDSDNPGVTTVFNFAGSNQLATQINEGAPADVFASANHTTRTRPRSLSPIGWSWLSPPITPATFKRFRTWLIPVP